MGMIDLTAHIRRVIIDRIGTEEEGMLLLDPTGDPIVKILTVGEMVNGAFTVAGLNEAGDRVETTIFLS